MFQVTCAARVTQTVLGLWALASLLAGCGGQMDGGVESQSQSVTTQALPNAFPLSEAGAVVVDNQAADFKLEPTAGYHGITRSSESWTGMDGYQGSALTALSGSTTGQGLGAASLAQWTTIASKGSVDVYAYVTPARGLTTWAVYCIFNQYAAAPTCTQLDQSRGEAGWVFLGNVEATGTIQVVLDPAASPGDGTRVLADAIAFVPAP